MISIVIPTFNRASLLKVAIESICLQNVSPEQFEILVVDNGSADNTKQVAKAALTTYPDADIRYLYEPEPGLLSGRHRGALEARGEILTFVDDDIEADANWLQAIKDAFNDSSVQIVGGRNLPKYEVEPPEWLDWFWSNHPYGRYCGYLSLLDFGLQVREIDANYVWGLNFSIRKSALFELGGFHPDCIPKHLQQFQGDGETGLTRRANRRGYKAIYQPLALIFHFVSKERMTFDYFEQRSFYQGVCDSYSDIRAGTGKLQQVRLIDKLKANLRVLKEIILERVKKTSQRDALNKRFYKAYLKGYQFHQNAVSQDPALVIWITRKDYWDYKLPLRDA